jgi:hypothetical protein
VLVHGITQRLQRSAHRAADLGAALEARLSPIASRSTSTITLCPLCGGQLRVYRRLIAEQSAKQFAKRIADITDPDLIRKILDHVNSRAPPSPAASPRQTTPDPSRSVRRTLISLR